MRLFGTILLTEVIEPEDDQFVAFCPELGTATCGDTVSEALSNLQEAIEVHLNGLEEIGDRQRVFEERGIEIFFESVDVDPTPVAPQGDEVVRRVERHRVLVGA